MSEIKLNVASLRICKEVSRRFIEPPCVAGCTWMAGAKEVDWIDLGLRVKVKYWVLGKVQCVKQLSILLKVELSD